MEKRGGGEETGQFPNFLFFLNISLPFTVP